MADGSSRLADAVGATAWRARIPARPRRAMHAAAGQGPGEDAPGFDDFARLAAALCDAPAAVLWLDDAAGPRVLACHGVDDEGALALVQPHRRRPAHAAGQAGGLAVRATAPLPSGDGGVLGHLCVLGRPSRLGLPSPAELLAMLARQAAARLVAVRQVEAERRARQALQAELSTFQRELVSANVKLLREARQDALSGLPNRRALEDLRERFGRGEFDACDRYAVVAIDIDHFKRINDSHGHAAGDEVIRRLGQALRGCVRGNDVAGRHGGEEFVAFLPGADIDGARRMAERLRAAIARIDAPCAFTVSIGVAAGRIGREGLDAVMERADQALYRAKREGRDRIVAAQDGAE